jgi:hypothetical protein
MDMEELVMRLFKLKWAAERDKQSTAEIDLNDLDLLLQGYRDLKWQMEFVQRNIRQIDTFIEKNVKK